MKDDPIKDELDKLLEETKDLNEVRNSYIHALWANTVGNNSTLTRVRNTAPGNYKKVFRETDEVSAQDIQNDVIKIAELSAKFADWQHRVQGSIGGMRTEPVEPQ
jgi:hypothetical protein